MRSAEWYAAQPIPPRLIEDLARAPVMPEWMIDRYQDGKLATPSLRACQVLACAANGQSVKETAVQLGIAFETVKHHRKTAIFNLAAVNVTQAVATAISRGLLRER